MTHSLLLWEFFAPRAEIKADTKRPHRVEPGCCAVTSGPETSGLARNLSSLRERLSSLGEASEQNVLGRKRSVGKKVAGKSSKPKPFLFR